MEKILNIYSLKRSSTTEMMDEFEGYGEDNKEKYEKLCLKNVLYIFSDDFSFYVDLIIERVTSGQKLYGDITPTILKNGKSKYLEGLANYIADTAGRKTIMKELEQTGVFSGKTIQINPSYQFRAQTSLDRSGYGKIWHGDDLIYEKNYGDTTVYGITEAVINLYGPFYFSTFRRRGDGSRSVKI